MFVKYTPGMSLELTLEGLNLLYMCCDLAGSVRKRDHWLRDAARKRNAFLLFSIDLRIVQLLYIFGTTGPIQVGVSAKCTCPNEDFNQIENWKCDMFDFRLIPLDHITYDMKHLHQN